MSTKTINVPNISCDGCVNTIKSELQELAGVAKVDGVVDTKSVTVEWGDPANWAGIADKMKEIGYAPAEA